MRNLVVVLGDQLDPSSAAFDGFENDRDVAWMAETFEEATHVWSHRMRIAVFFSAMRHFREELRERGLRVEYHELSSEAAADRGESFSSILETDLRRLAPERVLLVEPGDYRVRRQLVECLQVMAIPLEIRADRHFFVTLAEFDEWAEGRKNLVLEHFYRKQRQQREILLRADGGPEGEKWNFDDENRKSFGKHGPGEVPPMPKFRSDALTKNVLKLIEVRFGEHPGKLEEFGLPVTRAQALAYLDDFVEHRLPLFGTYEDAMWSGEPFLYHSRLSLVLNLHLIHPRECVERALEAYEAGHAPLNSVEGFVRQILGWREFIRGIYWREMPSYAERNELSCDPGADVPSFFWDGDTDMACVRQSMTSVIDHGYAHHIQRLMVLGLYALLVGVHPYRFHEWHMAMYLDAIDWVSLPNTLGMSQYGDGGIVGTKPYCATGKYIDRMSNYCKSCRYDPRLATGADACPFTTLYWDFLDRHRERLAGNRRMTLQLRNLSRKDAEMASIRERAEGWKT